MFPSLRSIPAILAMGLSVVPLPAQTRPAFLPTRAGDPAVWTTFSTCLEWMEHHIGSNLPPWVVRSHAFGYTARRPLYDPDGHPRQDGQGASLTEPVLLSGRVFLPPAWRVRPGHPVPLVIYCHGTTLLKDGVASEFGGHEWLFGAAAAAYYGYAVAMPDGPGMGAGSTDYHPFCHGRSLAYATLDAIPALRTLLTDLAGEGEGPAWNGRVFLMGYSEGGYAALAAAREMETHREAYGGDEDFLLAGSACMAGPFDISGTTRLHILDRRRPFPHPFFIPYVICGYGAVYGSILDPGKALDPRLLATQEDGSALQWVNGCQDGLAVDARIGRRLGLGTDPVAALEMLRPAWAARNLGEDGWGSSPIREILEENDLHRGWTPTRPILFSQDPEDQDVPVANTRVTLEALNEALCRSGRSAPALLAWHPLPAGVGHLKGALLAPGVAFDWIWRQGQADR